MKPSGKTSLPQKGGKKLLYDTNSQILNHIKLTVGKPTIVEAQRILHILDKLIQNIGLLIYLDNDFILKFNDLGNQQRSFKLNKAVFNSMTKQSQNLIIKQSKFELQFKPYANMQAEGMQQQKKQEAERLKKDMQTNFRQLLRQLSSNPEDLKLLKQLKPPNTINPQMTVIHQCLQYYKLIMQKKLATAADEEETHERQLDQLKDKISSLQKSKDVNELQLQKLKQDRAKHAQQKKNQIDKLRSHIEQVINRMKKDIESAQKKNKQEKEQLQKQQKQIEQKLQSQINVLRNNLTKLKEQNAKEQTSLKVKKTTSEDNLKDVIKLYDQEMDQKTKEKSKLYQELKEIKDRLHSLKTLFQEVEAERERQNKIIEEQKKRKRDWQWQQKRKNEAVKLIQDTFKAFKESKVKRKKKKR